MNCKYMNMLRVVRGNAFKLKIAVEAYTPSGRRIDSFALGEAVLKLDKNGTLTTKEYTILEGTTILVAFDGSESLGVYGFQMSGEYEGEAWRWANAEIFQIVESNVKAHIPEGCVLLDDTYNMALKIVLSGGDGITFTPSVSEQGIISWTNDGGLPNPEPRNIRGPRGEQGPQGEVGPQGPRGQMGLRGQIGPKGDKGDKGDTGATPVLDVTASVDENVGNPMVVVESFGPAEHRTFDFQFKNLKGQKGETGATGPQGPQGQQGEPGNYTKPASGIPLSDLNGNVASGIVYDVTANNSGATFASLSALLSSGSLSTLIPTSVRKGGMQIRFVHSNDNKYVQCRYMSSSTAVADFTNVANWQGVDEEPTAGSDNLVKSGGTAEGIGKLQLQLFKGIVNHNGVWQLGTNKQHFLIPVNGGESVVFDAESNYMYCAFLKTYTTPVAGATPDFCTGYEGRQGKSESSVFTIPSDCRYFIIDIGESSYIPTLLKINGIDITNGIYGCIFGIGENLNTISDKLLSFSYMQLGGICAGTGTAPIDRVINYDSSLKVVTLPQDITFLYKSIGGTTDYKSISATTLDVSTTAIATSAIKIVYDKSDDTIKALPYNTQSTKSQYLIAGLRRATNVRYCSFVTSFPWAIDKIPYGIEESDLVLHTVQNACVPPIVGGYIDYDSLKNTLTIPRNIIVKAKNIGQGNTNYLATSSEIVLDVPQSTSALILVYDKNDETFKFVGYSANITPTQYFILGFRSGLSGATPAITSLFPWSINGCPYNIKIYNFEGRRAFVNGVNHQGFNRIAPANTLPAFKLSAKQGFKFVETDVRFTSDGIAVLLHDETINATARNSDGTALESPVNIADITYEEALEYDFGIWKGEEYAGTKIPTFEEFIVLCRNLGLAPYVEVKLGTQQQIDGLFAIVDKYGMLKHTTWITTGEVYLERIAATTFHKERIGYVIVPIDISDSIVNKVLSIKNSANDVFIDANINMLTSNGIEKCKNNGIPLEVFTINKSNISLANNDYYSGFTSDEIDLSLLRYEDNL